MKIDNKKKIKAKAVLLIVIITVSLISILFGALTKFHQKQPLGFLLAIPVALTICSVRQLFNLKYFDYEHSGEVISIKYCHPWKTGRITPAIELPQTKLASFDIKKSLSGKKLCLTVNGSRNKMQFKYNLWELSSQQIGKIKQSLQNAG